MECSIHLSPDRLPPTIYFTIAYHKSIEISSTAHLIHNINTKIKLLIYFALPSHAPLYNFLKIK